MAPRLRAGVLPHVPRVRFLPWAAVQRRQYAPRKGFCCVGNSCAHADCYHIVVRYAVGCTDNPGYDKPMLSPCPGAMAVPPSAAHAPGSYPGGTTRRQAEVASLPPPWRELACQVEELDRPPPPLQPLGLPLYHNQAPGCSPGATPHTCDGDIEQQPVVLQRLSEKYDNFSAAFVREAAASGRPFLLYAAFTHVHLPQYAGQAWANFSSSPFQNALAEVDASVGVIMDALEEAGVENNTLVVLTGDNGPWYAVCVWLCVAVCVCVCVCVWL